MAIVRHWLKIRPWWCGLLAACCILGPALGSGDLLNLDLITTPHLRAPDWRWGVGPGLPHRVPMYWPLTWMANLTSGGTVLKALYVVALTVLFVGVWRLAASGDARIDAGIALLVTWSPFTITRVAVGHLNVVWAMAAIAWSAPALLRLDPGSSRRARRLGGLIALGGLIPGSWMLVTGAAGVLGGPASERRVRARRWLQLLPLQLAWIVPSALFAIVGPKLAGGSNFRPAIGALAPLEMLAGLGFWRVPNQVPAPPWWPLIAVTLVVLIGLGFQETLRRFGRPWVLITGAALAIPTLTRVPPFSLVLSFVNNSVLGTPLREAQRWWGLALVLLAPCLAAGAVNMRKHASETFAAVLPAAAALLLAGNGLWGARGMLTPVKYPSGWSQVRSVIEHNPGTTLALPWHQYLDVSFAQNRRVLNPLPDYLSGDVVASTDPELTIYHSEVDPRGEPAIRALDHPARASDLLAALGIRYIAAARLGDPDERIDALALQDGFTTLFTDNDIVLLQVDDSATRRVDWWFGPIGVVPRGQSPVAVAGAPGWVLGGDLVSGRSPTLDPGRRSGVLWYWPAFAVIFANVVSLGWWLRSLVGGGSDDRADYG